MATKRVLATVTGKVQGVYYRTYAQDEASKLGLHGWVRNLPGSGVQAAIEGEADKVDAMVKWLHTGSPMSEVTGVEVVEEKPLNETTPFNIRY
ncbi:MAG: acylphosphatase [Deltaproteobacteria bacterium CG23_combo_of_CG06-09_8_20_14_all_60_8]|nr:MAG: acylphosphatase [Desulfobacterales bacterium CG2_30_60_27]PIP44645.1 MAG: acylphosphatase [Deltaproteobacteria bacterium CG23_combo_of_CG06-09_8_20_14_all_60_8]